MTTKIDYVCPFCGKELLRSYDADKAQVTVWCGYGPCKSQAANDGGVGASDTEALMAFEDRIEGETEEILVAAMLKTAASVTLTLEQVTESGYVDDKGYIHYEAGVNGRVLGVASFPIKHLGKGCGWLGKTHIRTDEGTFRMRINGEDGFFAQLTTRRA